MQLLHGDYVFFGSCASALAAGLVVTHWVGRMLVLTVCSTPLWVAVTPLPEPVPHETVIVTGLLVARQLLGFVAVSSLRRGPARAAFGLALVAASATTERWVLVLLMVAEGCAALHARHGAARATAARERGRRADHVAGVDARALRGGLRVGPRASGAGYPTDPREAVTPAPDRPAGSGHRRDGGVAGMHPRTARDGDPAARSRAAGPRVSHVLAVSRDSRHSFSKPRVDAITLVAGLGVEGDAHAGVTVQHLSRVRRDPGEPNLRQVHLGSAAVVRITGLRNPCARLDHVGAGLMKRLVHRAPDGSTVRLAAVMGVVEAGGVVRAGDVIEVHEPDGERGR